MITNKNEHDYALCLNEDGSIKSVHRNKLTKYCKMHIVEFILIPMDDARQYVLYQNPIKKFSELHLTFDMYMTSFDSTEDLPIYEKIHSYDIICEDMFDFAKFIQSMTILYTIPERFNMNGDEFLDSFSITIESAYIDYVRKDGKRISERLKDTSGMVRSNFTISEFIVSVEQVVSNGRSTQCMMHPADLDGGTIVVDVMTSKWTMEDVDVNTPDTIGPSLTIGNYIFGVFSALTNTISFIPYEHLIMFDIADDYNIEIAALARNNYADIPRKLSEYLCEEVGYNTAETQMSIYSITDGDLMEYLDTLYTANGFVYTITDFIMTMLNCERVLNIYDMYNKVIHGSIVEYMIFQASAKLKFGKDYIYSFICEDIDMILSHDRTYYDRFVEETKELISGEIPERFSGCSLGILKTPPNILPF